MPCMHGKGREGKARQSVRYCMAWYRMICPAGLGARDGPNGNGGVGLPRMPNEDP